MTRTAVGAVAAGLPVIPGAWWSASTRRFECDVVGCARSGPHPAVRTAGLADQAIRDAAAAAACWRRQPYAVLIPTGEGCDVVDVPASFGRTLAVRLDARSALGPVVEAGNRWFFLTTPGGQLPALGGDVLVHGQGSWIMLPPSLGPGGESAGWLVRPARYGWTLPTRDDVIGAIAPIPAPAPRSIDLCADPVSHASPAPV